MTPPAKLLSTTAAIDLLQELGIPIGRKALRKALKSAVVQPVHTNSRVMYFSRPSIVSFAEWLGSQDTFDPATARMSGPQRDHTCQLAREKARNIKGRSVPQDGTTPSGYRGIRP